MAHAVMSAGPRGDPGRPVIVFYARVQRALLDVLEFYTEDIAALRRAGFQVRIETSPWRGAFAPGDACYAWWWHTATPVALAWRLRRKPVIVTGALGGGHDGPVRGPAKRIMTWVSARAANTNIAISNAQLDEPPLRGRRTQRVYCAVDTSFYTPGSKSETPTAVIVAQVNPISITRKGIDVAIAATPDVRRHFPDYRLKVVGLMTPAGDERIQRLRGQMDFSGVDVVGGVDREQKRALLRSAWLALQPSMFEGFGLSVAEAMACGTVPITTDRGSLPEVVGDAGLLLGSCSPHDFAGAIVTLLENRERRRTLEAAARARVEQLFSPDTHLQDIRRVLAAIGLAPVS